MTRVDEPQPLDRRTYSEIANLPDSTEYHLEPGRWAITKPLRYREGAKRVKLIGHGTTFVWRKPAPSTRQRKLGVWEEYVGIDMVGTSLCSLIDVTIETSAASPLHSGVRLRNKGELPPEYLLPENAFKPFPDGYLPQTKARLINVRVVSSETELDKLRASCVCPVDAYGPTHCDLTYFEGCEFSGFSGIGVRLEGGNCIGNILERVDIAHGPVGVGAEKVSGGFEWNRTTGLRVDCLVRMPTPNLCAVANANHEQGTLLFDLGAGAPGHDFVARFTHCRFMQPGPGIVVANPEYNVVGRYHGRAGLMLDGMYVAYGWEPLRVVEARNPALVEMRGWNHACLMTMTGITEAK